MAAAAIAPVVLTSGDDDPTTTGSTEDRAAAPPIPTEKRTPRPRDRDLAAVTAALRQLDPCQLFDLAVAKRRQRPDAATIPIGPHACFLAPSADFQPGNGAGLELRVGTFSDQMLRYNEAVVTLGGAKAYEYTRHGTVESSCRVVIPVSFLRAIELSYQMLDDGDLCPTVRQYAEATVAKLRDADTAAFRDTARPFSAWDGCSLLSTVIGETAGDYTYTPDGDKDPLGGCAAMGETDGKPDGKTEVGARIAIRYDKHPELTGPIQQIGGKAVQLAASGNHCQATWDQGPSGNPNPWFAATVVELSGPGCEATAAMVEQAIGLAGQQPAADSAPQHPLLFGPDENDTGSVGACVDVAVADGQQDCEPYQEVPVPTATNDIMAAPSVNRHAQCAVFKQAIAATFGTEFTPIAWGKHCLFVDPAHSVEITVNVDPVNVPSSYGTRSSIHTNREQTEIAGKAAVTYWDTDKITFDIYLSPHNNIDRPGNLHIGLEMIGGRGTEHDTTPTLPHATADQATKAMAKVVEQYFR